MSLLNDMLRDLDKQSSDASQPSVDPGMATAVPRNSVLKRWWLPAAAALALGYFFVVERNLLGFMPNPRQNYLEAPKPINIDPKWLAAVENHGQSASPVQTAVVGEPSASHVSDSAAGDADSAAVESDRAVAAVQIAATVETIHSESNNLKATQPQGSGVSGAADHQTAQRADQKTIATSSAEPAPKPTFSNTKLEPEAVAASPSSTTLTTSTPGSEPSQTAASLGPPQRTNTNPPAPRVTLSPEDRDYSVAQGLKAETLTQRETQAWLWLREGAVIDQTAFALADIYRAKGNLDRLQDLQDHLAIRAPNLVAYVLAQQALIEQDWPTAIRTLSKAQFQGRAEAQRLRLLGGIYQNTQQYPQALDVYSQLVAQRGAQVNDWLGQAVALDALGNRQGARDAYRRVHQMQHPDPQVNAYAQRREYELSQSFLSR